MRITFAGTESPLLAVCIAVVALALGAWLYRRALQLGGRRGAWLLGLRLCSIATLVLFIVRPVVSLDAGRIEDGRVAVVVDTSSSMALKDAMGGAPRLEAAQALIADLGPRLDRIAPLDFIAFDRSPRRLEATDVPGLRARSDGSEIGAALRAAGAGGPRPVAIVLLTDGRDTGAASPIEAARAAGAPVFPVAIGAREGAGALRDAAVAGVSVAREALVGTTVPVRVELSMTGFEPQTGALELRQGERVLARAEVALRPGRSEAALSFVPEAPGLAEYEVRLAPLEGERLLENNARTFPLSVSPERLRVLLYDGAPRWEYRYVRRALSKDAGLAVAALVRTNVDRLYGQGAADLAAFPAAPGALERFGAVLLGDVGRTDLAPAQAEALRAWVEAGGGLVVSAGRTLLGPEGLRGSALEAALPIALDGAVRAEAGPLAVHATREGEAHPALADLGPLLPVDAAFAGGAPKAGAEVLAMAGGVPAIVAQRYGRGRVVLVSTDATWGWCASAGARGGEALHARLWGQLVRWAASRDGARGAGGGTALSTDKEIYAAGEAVNVSVSSSDARKISIEGPAGTAEIALAHGAAVFHPPTGGPYTARIAGQERRFLVERDARELAEPTVDERLLARIASETGGAAFTQATASLLPAAVARVCEARRARAEWAADRSPWLFLVFVALLGADWMVRRWLGSI